MTTIHDRKSLKVKNTNVTINDYLRHIQWSEDDTIYDLFDAIITTITNYTICIHTKTNPNRGILIPIHAILAIQK